MIRQDGIGQGGASWTMAFVLSAGYVVSFVDRQVLNLLLEQVRIDLAISDVQASLLVGAAFALFYVGAGLPLGVLADRVNRTRLITACLVVWSFMTAACGMAGSFAQLFLARMGVGIGEAGYSPAAVSMIGDQYTRERRSRAMGIYTAAIPLGMGLALIGGGALMQVAPTIAEAFEPVLGPIRPWQVVFVLVALPGLLLAPLIFMLREPPRQGSGERSDNALPRGGVAGYIWARRGTYAPLMCGLSALTVLGIGYGAWIPTLLIRTHGWSVTTIGLCYGLVALICGPLGAYLGGLACDRLLAAGHRDAHWRVLMVCIPMLALCYAIAPLMPSGWLTLAVLVPGTMAGAAPAAAAHAAFVYLTAPHFRARVFATYNFVQNALGLTLGPTLVAILTDYVFLDPAHLRYSMTTVAILAGVAGTVLIALSGGGFRTDHPDIDAEPAPLPA